MSLLSTKGMYGLSAMYELSLKKTDKPTQIKEISASAGIPQNYLEQLLVVLRKAGLVTSIRGAHGGYLLAKKANEIFVKDVLIALEGNLHIVEQLESNPAINLFYKESNEKLEKIFDISLLELQEYQEKIASQLTYSI